MREGASSRELGLELDRSEPVMLELQAATRNRRIAWTATLSVSRDGGPEQTVTVDDSGQPFRVTSARSADGYAATFGDTGVSGFARERSYDRGTIRGC